jgi:hypothetical protein
MSHTLRVSTKTLVISAVILTAITVPLVVHGKRNIYLTCGKGSSDPR